MNKEIKKAMILCIGCKSWNFPKHILVETDGKEGEYLDDIAKRAFEKYKMSQQNEDINLVTYNYYGTVEMIDYK